METHIVQHELLHAIGLWHEHMRFDRDRYIRVHYENIRPGFESQFNRIPSSQSTTYNLPYDYKSVMHYGKTAFALPGRISMETFDRKYTNVIGQQHDASPSDYLKVCKIYGCNRCNGGSVTPGGTDEEPDPWNPKPKPVSPDDGKCMDKIPQLCAALHLSNVLNCNGNGKNYCCATCKRRGGDSSGSSYDDDYYDSY
ncbi:astacin [Dictyocaulus viviparus]|uniref:Metalloendopeptidase n=1 Tax=Dictyocaulus viviparus TaxID=29172 RepID=A0A0D8X841_DICVI|nr:astacin [Dictyocaulus viviparus]